MTRLWILMLAVAACFASAQEDELQMQISQRSPAFWSPMKANAASVLLPFLQTNSRGVHPSRMP